jgi:hypothetical protein
LNLQADGALVVVPPSLHYSGNYYEWEASSHPDDVPLAPLPYWLKAMGAARDTITVTGVDLPDTLPVIRLQDLKVSHRIKYLIQTGEDPDDPTRYCYPNGTPDRSRALFAVIQALLGAGHDDATIASVVMDQRYGISEKVLSQKNAKNPRYWDQTKTWMAKEIARAKAKQLLQCSVNGPAPQPSAPTPASPAGAWEKAIPVGDFLQQQDVTHTALATDLIVPGAITIVAAPRGTGKSLTALALGVALASGGVFRGQALHPTRVLLVDRDNPPAIVRTRLHRLGATAGHTLDVMTRDEAPPLKDKATWAGFPVDKYQVVLIDSLGAATEGISEKEGKQTQEFLATLKDLAHRGPAILALDNTNKAATSYRGRGEKADAVDILYEARDITGWTPASGDAWWESLPEYGDHTWQQRTTRRNGQAVLRIALIPSKYRLGIEPDPFAIEIDTTTTPWSLRDVTGLLAHAGADAAHQARQQTRQKLEQAATALKAHLEQRSPDHPLKKTEAIAFLRGQGLTRTQARNLLEDAYNADVYPEAGYWRLQPDLTQKGPPICVYLTGAYHHGKDQTPSDTASNDAASVPPIFADGQPGHGQDGTPGSSKNGADCTTPDLGRGSTGVRQRSTSSNGSVSAGENAAPLFAAEARIPGEDILSPAPPPAFAEFTASVLWCASCRQAQTVRLEGTAYRCTVCSTPVGTKTATSAERSRDGAAQQSMVGCQHGQTRLEGETLVCCACSACLF